MITHWHEDNPWKDEITYVQLEELAECYPHGPDSISRWFQYGDKLDAYILPGNKEITAGVRFGPEGSDYLSPGFDEHKLRKLLEKYREIT